ncbi:MAG: M20/M25/M40 family metallo-hydrolase [Dehalococcoidia bacterium]|nr:M20/M25/M40 family metallo-hydrolase [Dehalococcoidia bacterium]
MTAVDWEAVTGEAVDILSQYVRIQSVNPPGDETSAARFLADVLARDGIESTTYDAGNNRVNLAATLPGRDGLKPLTLLNHTDVVPVQEEYWSVEPFSGMVRDGQVWGRGALDMKGMGVMELLAMLLLKRQGIPLKRPLVFLAVADEEAGGAWGIEWLDQHHREVLDAEWVINEGSYGFLDLLGQDRPVFAFCPAEKTPLWLTLRARGPAGHGSVPRRDSAPVKLTRALARINDWQRETRILPVMEGFFSGLERNGILPSSTGPRDVPAVAAKNPSIGAMTSDTISLTTSTYGVKINVIPALAEATLDCRLLPDREPDEFIAELRRVIDDESVEIETIFVSPSGLSDMEGELVASMRSVTRELVEDSVLVPLISPGFTDSRTFRRRGIAAYGFVPALLRPEELATFHGHDERISIENLKLGTQVLYELALRLCGP